MKKIKNIVAILFLTSLATSCSKNNDNPKVEVEDCLTNDYGLITVNYANLSDRHSIILTKTGTSTVYREKITGKGIANDTLRVPPGNYQINIDRINSANESLENFPAIQKSPKQCINIIIDTNI